MLKNELPKLRNAALGIGQGRKFFIDISRFEYVDDKEPTELDGYRIYVYSPLMIACEKLRAICQQMNGACPCRQARQPPGRAASPRLPRHPYLVEGLALDMRSPKAPDITRRMYELKQVELDWLGNINNYREFQGFPSVRATVSRDFVLQAFDLHVVYVVKLALASSKSLATSNTPPQ